MSKELEEKLIDQLNRGADRVGLKDPKLKEEKVNNILEEIKRFNTYKDFFRGVYFCADVECLVDKV